MKTFQQENPKKLSDYEIWHDCVLGRGAFGVVKAALIKKTKEIVCVKQFEKDGDILKSINSKELQLSAQMKGLRHQNLVNVLDVFDSLETEYANLFMEQCDYNLKEYCQKKRGKFTNEEMKNFMKQITDGYIFLEEHKIIHRDIKPENILIKKEEDNLIFKLGDFGCGKIMEQTDLVKTEAGTNYYQAPEIGHIQYDNKCDIYSFGIIVFEMLVGDKSFNSFKNNQLFKEKSLNQIFLKELQGVDHFFVNLLNNMIVYDRLKRISWQGLRQCLNSEKAPTSAPQQKIFIRQRTCSDWNLTQEARKVENNNQVPNNNALFQQFAENKSPQQFVKQPPYQFVPNMNLGSDTRIQTNFQPKQNFQPPPIPLVQPQNQAIFQREADLSPKIMFFPQSEIQNRGSNKTVNYGAVQGNNPFPQRFQFTNQGSFRNPKQ